VDLVETTGRRGALLEKRGRKADTKADEGETKHASLARDPIKALGQGPLEREKPALDEGRKGIHRRKSLWVRWSRDIRCRADSPMESAEWRADRSKGTEEGGGLRGEGGQPLERRTRARGTFTRNEAIRI